MIVVRNVFQLKFGQAKDAVELAREGLAIQKKVLVESGHREVFRVVG